MTTQNQQSIPLRERKKKRARADMHRAALELVHEQGLAKVTVDAIAERAGVSPRTFFNYWPSKEAAVVGISPDAGENLARAVEERPSSESLMASLEALTRTYLDSLSGADDLRDLRRQVMQAEPIIAHISHRAFADVEGRLIEALTARVEATGLDSESAREQATVVGMLGMALARSAVTLAFTTERELYEAYGRVRAYAAEILCEDDARPGDARPDDARCDDVRSDDGGCAG